MLYKMNRLPFLIMLMLCLCSRTQAQQTRTNKPRTTGAQPVTSATTTPAVAPPASTQPTPTGLSRYLVDDEDTVIENRLVALALNGPEYDASTHQTRINELDLKKTKQTWLNLLTLSSTYNDQSFKTPGSGPGQPTYVYPKYFFGITIPLGIIFSQGTSVKQARESLAYGKDQQEQLGAPALPVHELPSPGLRVQHGLPGVVVSHSSSCTLARAWARLLRWMPALTWSA